MPWGMKQLFAADVNAILIVTEDQIVHIGDIPLLHIDLLSLLIVNYSTPLRRKVNGINVTFSLIYEERAAGISPRSPLLARSQTTATLQATASAP